MVSTDSEVYLTWQDTRAGSNQGESEDVYFATLQRNGSDVSVAGDSSVPGWLKAIAAAAVGLGFGMVLVWAITRTRTAPDRA